MANVSKTMYIEMGHRLQFHQGKCFNIHGHSYKIEVFAEGDIILDGPSTGMVVDYAILKEAMKRIDSVFDHITCLQYNDPFLNTLLYMWSNDAEQQALASLKSDAPYLCMFGMYKQKFVLIELPPTAEILASIWLKTVADYFGITPMKFEIKVWETASSCCKVSLG